jgi:hypothetical protein
LLSEGRRAPKHHLEIPPQILGRFDRARKKRHRDVVGGTRRPHSESEHAYQMNKYDPH